MKIAVDAGIFGAWAGGVARYIAGLCGSLHDLRLDDIDIYMPVGENMPLVCDLVGDRITIKHRPASSTSDWPHIERLRAWQQDDLPAVLEQERPDVLLGPFYMCAAKDSPWAKVVTVHDLIFERHPEWFRREVQWYRTETADYLSTWGRASAVAADAVMCVSQTVAADVRSLWGVQDHKIATVYPGAAFTRPDSGSDGAAKAESREHAPYLLNVGGTDLRKNLGRLLVAFQRVRADGHQDLRLVLVNTQQEDLNASSDLLDHVVCLRTLTDAELAEWYQGALGFVLPTLAEGFGLANLESMSLGTPVITSDLPVLREVVGNAAMFVNPSSVEELTAAIADLVGSEDLRQRLANAGLARSKRFTYEATAIQTREVLSNAIRAKHNGGTSGGQ